MTKITVTGGDPQLPKVPAVVPSQIRAKAREDLEYDLRTLQCIIDDEEVKPNVRVSAIKLKATIGGVLSSASIPRDVVEEKIRETANYLRRRLGDDLFSTMAEDLTAIWDL